MPHDANGHPDSTLYRRIRRAPLRSHAQSNEIYVSSGRNSKTLYRRAVQMLIQEGKPEIILHALGKAILTAVRLALKIERQLPGYVTLHTKTASQTLTDEYVPMQEHRDTVVRERVNSSVHIHIRVKEETLPLAINMLSEEPKPNPEFASINEYIKQTNDNYRQQQQQRGNMSGKRGGRSKRGEMSHAGEKRRQSQQGGRQSQQGSR